MTNDFGLVPSERTVDLSSSSSSSFFESLLRSLRGSIIDRLPYPCSVRFIDFLRNVLSVC